jgi:hypothetical protein
VTLCQLSEEFGRVFFGHRFKVADSNPREEETLFTLKTKLRQICTLKKNIKDEWMDGWMDGWMD